VPAAEVVSDKQRVKADYGKLNEYQVVKKGTKAAVIALGTFFELGIKTAEEIEKKTGVAPTLINPVYITGRDEKLLEELKKDHDIVITLEDGVKEGGFGEKIAEYYAASDMKVLCYGLKKEFLDRYDANDILKENRLTQEQIAEDVAGLF
jgi:1-deoxy-D-xylulose-5-phosphate synthase